MHKKKLIACLLTMTGIISSFMLPAIASDDVTTNDAVQFNISDDCHEITSEEADGLYFEDDITYDEEYGVICSCGIPFSEHENSKTRSADCACGGRLVNVLPTYGNWHYSGKSRNCKHEYSNGHDYEQVRTYVTGSKCTRCSYYKERTGTQSKWICKGF